MFSILLKRKILTFKNKIKHQQKWTYIKNSIFISMGFFILLSLYFAFYRVLKYLRGVELIGELLIWKLTSMVFLMTFLMIVISSLIIAMTTLFYSKDLKFLFSMPVKEELIFLDKSINTVFYSSWSLIIILMPYLFALIKVSDYSYSVLITFLILSIPYAMLGAIFGIFLSMLLMYLFPSSKTRDIIWVLSSFSISIVYVIFRFSKPEKLLRPDMLGVIANYLNYLQAPTAKYLPSWWITKAVMAFSHGNNTVFIKYSFLLIVVTFLSYKFIYIFSKKRYIKAYSGAQSGKQKNYPFKEYLEFKLARKFKKVKNIFLLIFKEKKSIQRDVRYLSQIILIMALTLVYIFSIKNLPLENQDVKNFVSFLNILVVSFVVSAISLRFVFTSISNETNNFWIIKSLPLKIEEFMLAKFIFYFIPTLIFSLILVSISSYYLNTDYIIFAISVFITVITSFVITAYAIGFGAIFPDFNIENIHQIESSIGGFTFMGASILYGVITLMIFSTPVRIYFASGNHLSIYDPNLLISVTVFLILSFLSSIIIFNRGIKNLNNTEI